MWVTIAFLQHEFSMPGGRGSVFDVLETAKSRGVDVKVIFWRSPELEQQSPNTHFHGQDYQRTQLQDADYSFHARWDYLPRAKCHHEKSWLIDAGTTHEIGFVGGINLDMASVVEVGHPATQDRSTHDIYCELRGPSVTDVHHNFAQRWNEASERTEPDGSWPPGEDTNNIAFPDRLSQEVGSTPVQVSRTIRREQYRNGAAAVNAKPFQIDKGEKSTFEQYLAAIDNARRTIYIENQAIASHEGMTHLEVALQRGVQVVFLIPGHANSDFARARKASPELPMFEKLDTLASFPNFTLAAICSPFDDGSYLEIYIHAKVAIVDDHWATIGSCNFADRSFHSDTELNVTFWDDQRARQFRADLFSEHLALDTSAESDEVALGLFRTRAIENAGRKARGETLLGLAYAVDPLTYGL